MSGDFKDAVEEITAVIQRELVRVSVESEERSKAIAEMITSNICHVISKCYDTDLTTLKRNNKFWVG